MSFWVYILHCCDDSYYTRHTDDLDKRIAQHHAGILEGYTARRRPIKLVFSQEFGTREEALRAEFQIKGWTRRKKEALIKQDWQALKYFAKGQNKQDRS
jgi:tRNA/rRNA methyltransferase